MVFPAVLDARTREFLNSEKYRHASGHLAEMRSALASAYMQAGDLVGACRLVEQNRTLQLRQDAFTRNRERVQANLRCLLLRRVGRAAEAQSSFTALLEKDKSTDDSPHHRSTLLNNLSLCLMDLDRCDEAEPLLKEALELSGSGGKYRLSQGIYLNNLGQNQLRRGKLSEATTSFLHSQALLKSCEFPDSQELGEVSTGLARIAYARSEHAKAERHWSEAIDYFNRTKRSLEPFIIKAFCDYALYLRCRGRTSQAEVYEEESQAMSARLTELKLQIDAEGLL